MLQSDNGTPTAADIEPTTLADIKRTLFDINPIITDGFNDVEFESENCL